MKRRRRGENGAVHTYKPPGSQTWWIRYTQNGTQRRRNTGLEDESQARIFAATAARMVGLAQIESPLEEQRKLLAIAEELISGIRGLEGNVERLGRGRIVPTVREWFTRTLEEMTNGANGDDRHLKDSSINRIQNVHNHWLEHLAGLQVNLADAPVTRIGPNEVKGFLAAGKLHGFSGGTRRYALARIRGVFGRAVDHGLITSNPAGVKRVGRLKFDDKSIRRAFNPQQIAAILDAADSSPLRWLKRSALLGLFTGQRAGDICAMRWEDIRNLDSALPTIRIVQQKTGSTVIVPIAGPLQQALQGVPEAERNGHLLGGVAEAYLQNRRRRALKTMHSTSARTLSASRSVTTSPISGSGHSVPAP